MNKLLLRQAKLSNFCTDGTYEAELDKLLNLIREKMLKDAHLFSGNWRNTGLVGLTVYCVDKADRVYGQVVEDCPAHDKLVDEIEDLIALALNAHLYYNRVRKEVLNED